MNQTILVTGCCGFIGSNMCEFLLNKNYKVIGIDNFLTGTKSNMDRFFENTKFTFIEHDVCYPIKIDNSIDKILHFASTASPKDYKKFPIKTLQTGSNGTENVLNLSVKKKASILVASSSEVYGDPKEHPQKETYFGNVNPIGTRGVYDEAKRYLEAITMAYYRKKNLNTKIVRIFNTYGPNMRNNDGRAIPNFINQMIDNKNITVYGKGDQTRSFCYIDDTILGIYKSLKSSYNLPINIGNPNEYSIIELINIIKKIIPTQSKIIYSELPENDPKVRQPDITLAKNILRWTPKVNLHDGLQKTINYFYQTK